MLRRVLLWIGAAGLVVSIACLAAGVFVPGIQLMAVFGALTAGIVFERWRYERNVNRARSGWQATGERFLDPATGKLTEVYYNPQTGERDYRPADGHGSALPPV